MTEEEKAAYRGAGLVAFWARKKEIKEMIDAKHTKRNVYRRYGAEMNISYEQFARYVNKYIQDEPEVGKELERKDAEKENVTNVKSDPNYVTKTLIYDPNKPKKDLT